MWITPSIRLLMLRKKNDVWMKLKQTEWELSVFWSLSRQYFFQLYSKQIGHQLAIAVNGIRNLTTTKKDHDSLISLTTIPDIMIPEKWPWSTSFPHSSTLTLYYLLIIYISE